LLREIEIKSKCEAQQTYFNKINNIDVEELKLEDVDIVIDSSNKRLDSKKFKDFKDYKFSAILP